MSLLPRTPRSRARAWPVSFPFAVLLATLLFPATLLAQTPGIVRGTVTDSATGRPVAGVQISVGGSPRAVTNDVGTYTVTQVSPGQVTVRAQRIPRLNCRNRYLV